MESSAQLGKRPTYSCSSQIKVKRRRPGAPATHSIGKTADILIVDGNPLEDIRILQDPAKIETVILGGVVQISKIKPSDISVTVDFKLWNINQSFYDPQIFFPFDILEWKDLSPRTIELGVAREAK